MERITENKKISFFFKRQTNTIVDNTQAQNNIQSICQEEEQLNNWALILELADRLSRSEPESREAVKSLKKLIKLNNNQPIQIRAIRLTVILLLNSSDRFRLLVLKKLLHVLQELYNKSSKSAHKQPIQDILTQSLAILAYEFQDDQDLSAFTHYYNKIKPSYAPLNGTPLLESDPGLFTPPVHSNSTTQQDQLYQHEQEGLRETMPMMRDVKAEAEVARSNARLLIEALAFTSPAEMEANAIIQEFHSKCLQSQNQLMDDIPWATEQAARARTYYAQHAPGGPTQQGGRNGGGQGEEHCEMNGMASREEQLLSLLLSANSELVDAFRQHDELERLARNEREVRLVEERSRLETRLDPRAAAAAGWLDPHDHYPHQPHASGSSSNASPRPSLDRDSPPIHPRHSDSSPLSSTSAALQPQQQQHPQKGYTLGDDDHRSSTDSEFYARPSSPGPPISHLPEQDHMLVNPPSEPSEKALGKMRRYSGRSSSFLAAPSTRDPLSIDYHPSSHSSHIP
ncbi:hypothetical protein PCANC_11214 [Puccinia coronata f. sp. avenae]|uniref:VHS domain-containing protein n=1 Tax=Puccinia coronata f. sp. avenae TaxID=200324 RepID=A0A2N5V8I5_9BASI|nr:hypothetical protein PCANC_11214 [Puccinia coronata f. sp. avenae]